MAITSRDQILAHIAAGRHQTFPFSKVGSATPQAVGKWTTMYLDAGTPGAATAPSTTYANASDLAGSIFHTAVSPAKRYLWSMEVIASQNATLMVYDRLGHIQTAANALATASAKTISSAALPRSMDTNDLAAVQAWIEVVTATATTVCQINLSSYTNEAGTSARVGAALVFPAAATPIGWMAPFPLQAGDKGVSAISTATVSVASTGVGTANIMLMRPLAVIPVLANLATVIEFPNLPRVYDTSSIFLAYMPGTSAAATNIQGKTVCVYDA